MNRRVVITGMGAVTPLGNSVSQTWKNLKEGRSGVGPITIFDASGFPTQIAGEIKGLDASKWHNRGQEFSVLGRNSLFALEAASEAVQNAGLSTAQLDAFRYGVYFGAGDGGYDFSEYAQIIHNSVHDGFSVNPKHYLEESSKKMQTKALLEQEPFEVVHHLSNVFGAKGMLSNCLTACAASSQASGEASQMIRLGQADVMIAGGAHSMIHPLGLAGFNLLSTLSTRNHEPTRASRPFDKDRDGFVLAEGAGVLILEELEHAKKRKAQIFAELAGYGGTADAFRLTDPHPEGRGAIKAMQIAIKHSGLQENQIGYINAHGTSTKLNDQIETQAVKSVFGDGSKKIPMSSTKSMLGHMIAAAGAVELMACILAIREGILPPTINYETPDPDCDLDCVPNHARHKKIDAALSNSFGFGGQNIALIVKRYE